MQLRQLAGSAGGLLRIAADIAAIAPDGASLLEVGCDPGRLSILLARRYGLDVTGFDLIRP
jgi:cyclopropane fatty-acyl-phospholipid synthase-like methyltransferase